MSTGITRIVEDSIHAYLSKHPELTSKPGYRVKVKGGKVSVFAVNEDGEEEITVRYDTNDSEVCETVF